MTFLRRMNSQSNAHLLLWRYPTELIQNYRYWLATTILPDSLSTFPTATHGWLKKSTILNTNAIAHFRVSLSLSFKASLRAKFLLWYLVLISIWIKTDFHNKDFALALKWRLRCTRKWPILSIKINYRNHVQIMIKRNVF